MKTILSLVTALSVLFSQLNAPASVTLAQETNITEAVSASPTPSETQSPTPSVTEDAKETPTSQTTPTLSAETPSSAVTSTPESSPVETEAPLLSLRVDPEYVTVGAGLTLYWEVSDESLKEQLDLHITLTEELSLEKQGEMRFDETSRIVFIPVNSQNGELHLLAGDVNSDLVIYAALVTENGEIRSETKLFLPVKETFIFDEQGGVLVAEEGRVKVEIPKDALVETSSIAIGKPAGDSIPPFSLSGDPFEITAHGETSKEEQTRFSKEIMISVSYANLEIPEALEGNLYLYWYNPDIKDWQALPTTVDRKSKTIEGFTDHFTVFDINVNNWQSSRAPTVDSFQVSSFTGAATYSLPIEVPPGPGGFQPNLELSYNSQIVDQSTTATQASWVGMGWSLDTGSINLDSHGTYYDSDDTFFLNVAGVSTRLLKDASGVYHSIDENFWRIQESAGGGFEVWDKQGNIYYFQSGAPFPYEVGSCAGGDLWIEWDNHTWMLTKIKNSFGQEILYAYADQTRSVRLAEYIESEGRCYGSDYTGVTAKYPATITYAGGKYRIRLDKGSTPNRFDYRSGWDAGGAFQIYQKYRLQNVYVEQDVDGDGTFETILRRYEFEYESDTNTANLIFPGFVWTAGGKTSTLKSVKQYGVGGSTVLPATTFTYGDNLHLTRADNGYGGAVEFDYGFWYLPDVARNSYSITQLFGKSGYPCRLEDPSPWGPSGVGSDVNCGDGYKDNLHVRGTAGAGWIKNAPSASNQNTSQDLIRPGGMYKLTASVYMADTTSLRVGFYDGVNSNLLATGSPYYLMLPVGASTLSPLIEITGGTGYGQVGGFTLQLLPSVYRVTTKRLLDGNGHSYQFTYDYTNNGVDTAKFNDAYVVTSEACAHWSCVDNYFNEKYSEFRGNGKVTVTAADGTKTITEFHQDDIFKGRPISTISNDGAANIVETNYSYAFTPLPCEICIYWAGLSRNFVYSTSETTTVYGAAGGNTQTTYAYDTTYGNLTSQSQYVNGALYRATTMEYYPSNTSTAYLVGLPARQQVKNATGTVLAESLNLYDGANTYTTAPTAGTLTATSMWTSGTQYSQITFGYDTWGNQNSVTAYSGYGSASSAPMVGAATTTTTFDSAFHVYPVSQTTPPTANAPAGLATTWAYDYNGDSVDDYILGLPTRETDPNGNQTSAQYDAFGRMTKLIRPGDSSASSTISISYSGGFPFTTTITQKIDPAQSYIVQRVYDGIGRQTKIVSGGTIVDTMYISPTVTKQSVPYTGASPNLFTITTVNPTAHTSTMTAPDGNSATTTTNGLTTTFTDARGNLTTSVSDVLGRVLSITPPTGPAVSYTYDEFDRLKTATRGGVTTTLNYDNAGRKLNMTDPDMGYWVYNYDALGNLKTQTDARGCVLTLGYDSLSRLLSKTSSGSGCGTQVNTSYTYDSGVNGKGMRTSMTDASGNSAWEYDTRGRLKKETKTLTGISPFITEWDYNSADLPTWMKYPDGEEVTSNYNDRMLLNSVIGANTYVSFTSYDATGRMDDRLLGNGLTQNYSYYGWAETAVVDGVSIGQGGRLKNISVGTLQNLTYTYDTSGNARGIADAVSNETQNFGYDTLDRLTSANAISGPANYSETYAYNAVTGNLTTKGSLTLQYNDPAHVHAVTNAGNNAYSYDSNGNQTTRVVGGQTYTLDYDAENRLVSVEAGMGGFGPSGSLAMNRPHPNLSFGVLRDLPQGEGNVHLVSYDPQPLQQSGFPSTSVLDNFNRANGAIGSNWSGQNTSSFTVSSNQLAINSSGLDSFAAWSPAPFGADQEAYVTLSQVSASGLEQGLLLKTASDASAALKVVYVASAHVVRVFTFTSAQGWAQRGLDISVTMNNGDQLGARAKANGDVEVYRNGSLLGTVSVNAWAPYTGGGYIGLWYSNTSGATVDDFGGGNISSSPTATPTITSTPTRTPTSTNTPLATNTPTNTPTAANTPMSTATSSVNTITLQPNGTGGLDTFLLNSAATTNYGTQTFMGVGEDNTVTNSVGRSLIKFDLSSIPANATILSAKLSLWTNTDYSSNDRAIRVYRLKVPFNETQATWNIRASGSNWQTAGANGSNDREFTDIGSILILANEPLNTQKQIALDSAKIQEMINGAFTNNGFILMADTELNDGFLYNASEHATASQRPKLVIQYQVSSATSTPAPTATATNTPTPTFTATPTQPPAFTSADFVYDGDGRQVKSVINGVTTLFVGSHYHVENGVVVKYYFAGAQRIAMRKNGTLSYILTDHLGSTSMTTNASGALISQLKYKVWGEIRYSSGSTPTNYKYTGQREEAGFGLYFYNARWYDPVNGRFSQADTIVPAGVQGLDRYAYVNNSPINYVDPSGHLIACENGDSCKHNNNKPLTLVKFEDYTGSWSSFSDTKEAIEKGAYQLGIKIANTLNLIQRNLEKMGELEGDPEHYSPEGAFLKVFDGPITFTLLANAEGYAGEANSFGGINIYLPRWVASHPGIVIHELFHRLENILGIKNLALPAELRRTQDDYGDDRSYNGFFGGKFVGQFALPNQLQYGYETLADMGLGWSTNKWDAGNLGTQRKNYMESLMIDLLVRFIP